MSYEEIKTQHPSYGLVGFSRVTGNPGRLFGSPMTNHQNFVRLRIGTAERIHRLGEDVFFGAEGNLIEVNLSAAQFAELVTTMNISMGVPCTICRLSGKSVPCPPDEPTESEHVQLGFEKDARSLAKKMSKTREEIAQLFESKKNLGKQDREEVLGKLDHMIMQVSGNMPFMLEQFAEATQKVVQHAKTEIDAFVTSCALAEGLQSLAKKMATPAIESQGEPVGQLPEKKT